MLRNVLSLFDGMSCGQLSLSELNIPYENYYASEIDKYAIEIAMKNFPNTIQIGDVLNVKGNEFNNIDLLIAGSPCQGLSLCGKKLNLEDPRSKLYYEFSRILKETKPKYFLLENVIMNKDIEKAINDDLGVEGIHINSSLVSAQNRKRIYWTNIPVKESPTDRNITLRDIIDLNVDRVEIDQSRIKNKDTRAESHKRSHIDFRRRKHGLKIRFDSIRPYQLSPMFH